MLQTITWDGQALKLLDQTKLPLEQVYVEVKDEKQMWHAIRDLVVRGAPAIGVAAGFGVYLGVKDYRGPELFGFYDRLNEVADYLITARPTAVNLSWAVDRMRRAAREAGRDSFGAQRPQDAIEVVKKRLLDECLDMAREDIEACKKIGEHGLKLLGKAAKGKRARPIEILTHCNAGGLATVQYGTALAPIYVGKEQGIEFHVWSDETRPLLQGSRIKAFELQANGIPVTIICDSMAASVMAAGQVDAVIVGADRIAANGDVANKIGTLSLAINARHFGIPFYVAAPTSSIDMRIKTGAEIPIEERPPEEISNGLGKKTAPDGSDIYNPAFDVTPAEFVTAIITEKGTVKPPYGKVLAGLFEEGTGSKLPVARKASVARKPKKKSKPKVGAKARSKRAGRG
ncbi:MAG TPA: S-methyl-5-thioribose-1-phosphate isomerase [Tepidisphaeraceae bacterium]|nr:S-methyl-5-thioribose-1-phosphate isomerase [Tepidisphaeraceae bacterium]